MEISGKQSTKSCGTQRQEINKVIWYVPGEHYALAAGTSSDLPAAAHLRREVERGASSKSVMLARHVPNDFVDFLPLSTI